MNLYTYIDTKSREKNLTDHFYVNCTDRWAGECYIRGIAYFDCSWHLENGKTNIKIYRNFMSQTKQRSAVLL